MSDLSSKERAEVEELAERVRKINRRKMLGATTKAAFVVPVLGALAVPREALATGTRSSRGSGGYSHEEKYEKFLAFKNLIKKFFSKFT